MTIFTDETGKPIEKPQRADCASDAEYVEAFHAYRRRLVDTASRAVYHSKPKIRRKS